MKKKRLLLATLMTAVCALFGVAAVACNNGTETTYSVSFNMQGHGTAIAAITDIASGSKIEKPQDPTDDDYDFGGWYKDAACEYMWNFDVDTVTSTRVLYALWTEKGYTVTFDVQGKGTAPAAATGVKKGAKVQAPEEPAAYGYVFDGWFTEPETTTEWNFATGTITGDKTLYAKWSVGYQIPANQKEITFTVNAESVRFRAPGKGSYTIVASNKSDGSLQSESYKFADGSTGDQYVLTVNTTAQTVTYKRTRMGAEEAVVLCQNAAYTENGGAYTFTYTDNDETATVTFSVRENGSLSLKDTMVVDYWTDEVATNIAQYDSSFTIDSQEFTAGYYTENLMKGFHTVTSTKAFEITISFNSFELPLRAEAADYIGAQKKVLSVAVYGPNMTVSYDHNPVVATGYDEEKNIYSFTVGEDKYGLKFNLAVNGDVQSIEVYMFDGGEWKLLDTLTKIAPYSEVSEDLTVSASGTQYTKQLVTGYDYAVYKISDLIGQWVAFEFEGDLEIYWLNVVSGTTGAVDELITATSGESVPLTSEYNYQYIAVKPANGATSVTFTAKEGTLPQGLSAENPLTMTGNTYTNENTLSYTTYYLTYTAQAGEFKVTVSYDGGGFTGYTLYTIDGEEYGFNSDAFEWVNPAQSHKKPYIVLTFTEGQVLNITVTTEYANNFSIEIVENTGEEEAGELTAGTYKYSDEYDGSFILTITGDKESGFTADYRGVQMGFNETGLTVTANADGTYGFSFEFEDMFGLMEFNVVITAQADGSLLIEEYNGMGGEATFTKDGGSVTTPADLASGTYRGEYEGATRTFVINVEAMTVDYSEDGDSMGTGLALTNNDGSYSFTFNAFGMDYTITFTVSQDSTGKIILHVVDGENEYDAPSVAR